MISVAIAFAAFLALQYPSFPRSLIPALLLAAIPLIMLALITGRHWIALFRPVGVRAIGATVLTAVVTMLASLAVALIVKSYAVTAPNPLVATMAGMSPAEYVLRLVPTLPQLLGEEILTILPFLALLWLFTQRLHLGLGPATFIALLGSSAIFAAAHLSTYDWNYAQCFGVIGASRIVLTLSYIWTRNLWVSTGAHIMSDWVEFTAVWGVGHVPIGTA